MNSLHTFLNAFNKVHKNDNIVLMDYRSTVSDQKFPAMKKFKLVVKNIKDATEEEVFTIQKVLNKSDIPIIEDAWNAIYEEMIQRILEYYGGKI